MYKNHFSFIYKEVSTLGLQFLTLIYSFLPLFHLFWHLLGLLDCSSEGEWAARRAHRVYRRLYHPRGEGLVWSGFPFSCFFTLFPCFHAVYGLSMLLFILSFAFNCIYLCFPSIFFAYRGLSWPAMVHKQARKRLLAAFGRLFFYRPYVPAPCEKAIQQPFTQTSPGFSFRQRVNYRIFID